MFNIFHVWEPDSPFTTYLDISDNNQLKVVPNAQYTRRFFEVKEELYPFSRTIMEPVIRNNRLEFDHTKPQTGIKVYRHLNLEAILANLVLQRSFIVDNVPKLLREAYKPPVVSQEDSLRKAGLMLREQLAALTEEYQRLSDENVELTEKLNELELMMGDKWQDVKTMISKFNEVNIQVKFLENYSEHETHTYIFKNVGLQVDDAKLKRVCDTLPALLNWVSHPPSYEVSRGEIALEFDTRDIEAQLDAVQEEWLPSVAQCESNLLIFGARGSGKTSLVNNYTASTLNRIPDAKVEYLQPKPENDTPINLVPTAIGFEECFKRHEWLISEYERRNEENIRILKSGSTILQYDPIFAIYEELQTMIMKHPNPKKFCKEIETMVSFGRTLGINVLGTAQVANIRNFPGWTKASLTQYNRLYIGEAIKTAIDYAPTLEDKRAIREQYAMYRASNRKFYGLLMRPNGETKIYDLPLPKTYEFNRENLSQFVVQCKRRNIHSTLSLNPHVRDMVTQGVLQCPSCGSSHWIPHNYNAKPGTKVHLRCSEVTCKTKLSLTL